MLKELHIKNLAIIGDLRMEFSEGFTVLTGETGAGKSILIDGLNLALGEKADREMVREGCEEAVAEALFDIGDSPEVGALLRTLDVNSMGEELLLRRTVSVAGKSRCAVNGSTVPAAILKRLGDHLVDLHGQHEHQLLLNPAMHLEFLDAFGELASLRTEMRGTFLEWRRVHDELESLRAKDRDRSARIDLLSFQVNELESARLVAGEEEGASADRSKLANVQRISQAVTAAYDNLMGEGGTRESLGAALSGLRLAQEHDRAGLGPRVESLARLLESLLEEADTLRRMRDGLEADPNRLETLEERLDMLARFKRKYGPDIPAILEYLAKAKAELAELSSSDEKIRELEGREEALRGELSVLAGRLSDARQKSATAFAGKVAREVRDLAMENADFGVKLSQVGDPNGPVESGGSHYRATETGIDTVDFYIAPNVGAGTHPLKDIASGGELSRVMLALKSVLAKVDRVATMVFDEIDAGIGGRVAEVVGRKLALIGAKRQVICITHLPQIASRASSHYHIKKGTEGGETLVGARKVAGKDRIREIARMVAGEEITATALQHAESLLKEE